MSSQIVPLWAHRDSCAVMYEHFNQLILQNPHSEINARIIWHSSRKFYEDCFLMLTPVEAIADQAGLTKIDNGYAVS